MKTTKAAKIAGMVLGATLITATAAYADANDGKCGVAKCGGEKVEKKIEKKADAKCGASKVMEKPVTKVAPAKCGASKDMEKPVPKVTPAKCGNN